MITIEDLVHGFLKANYSEVTKADIKWEKLGNLDNGQVLQAGYKDASVIIRAIKNGDFVQKLESILKDYEGFSKRALEGASKFDWKKIGRRYSELYAEVIQANGGIYEI